MSTPEPIVVSLEKARELEQAGWPQKGESHFYWSTAKDHEPYLEAPPIDWDYQERHSRRPEHGDAHYAAPTAEEILRRLPTVQIEMAVVGGVIKYIRVADCESHTMFVSACDNSLVEALAEIYCRIAEKNRVNKSE